MRYEPKKVILTQVQLEALCKEWQETLRLQDWDISLAFEDPFALQNGEARADSQVYEGSRFAHIRFVKPEKRREDVLEPYDMERTLVHELIHIYTECLPHRGLKRNIPTEEAMTEHLAQALVALKRAALPSSVDGHREVTTQDMAQSLYGAPV